MSDLTALNAARRTNDLTELGDDGRVDVVVIGGGITGAGIALDAASRGLSVVLVEKHDLAFGTSRWSSKLVHGGLRYLATGNVGIARRSAVERGILMTRNAPHLVSAMAQLVPLLPSMSRTQRALIRTGFVAGDALRILAGTKSSTLPRSRRIGAEQAVAMAPTVRRDGLDGGLLAYDGQLIDDARLVTAVARTAAQNGARILTRVSAVAATGTSVRLRDELTGESLERIYGYAVRSSLTRLREANEMRRLMETGIARLASQRREKAGLAAMQRALQEMRTGLGDPSAFTEADILFHLGLALATGNSMIRVQMEGMRSVQREVSELFSRRANRTEADWRATIARHDKIAGAIESGDAEAAERSIVEHYEAADIASLEVAGSRKLQDSRKPQESRKPQDSRKPQETPR